MNRRRKGMWWEAEAARFLEEAGYTIVERGFRTRKGEIDLIIRKDSIMAFVEVKMRSSEAFGLPQEAVDKNKQKKIIDIARFYLAKHPEPACDIRFDVIAICGQGADRKITHIENAFWVEES